MKEQLKQFILNGDFCNADKLVQNIESDTLFNWMIVREYWSQ